MSPRNKTKSKQQLILRQKVEAHIIAIHELIGSYGWSDDALEVLDTFSSICDDWLGPVVSMNLENK